MAEIASQQTEDGIARQYIAFKLAPPLSRSTESRLADIAASLPLEDREFLAALLAGLGADPYLVAMARTSSHVDRRRNETINEIAATFYATYPSRTARAKAIADDLASISVTGSTARDRIPKREALRRLIELADGEGLGFRTIWNVLST